MRQCSTAWLMALDAAVRRIDNAPIPVYIDMRSNLCRTVLSKEECGILTSHRVKRSGVRMHLITTMDQEVDQWLSAPASYREATLPPAVRDDAAGLGVIGDHAFHDPAAWNCL